MDKADPFVGDASKQVISNGTAQCRPTAPNVDKKATFQLNVPKRTRGLAYHSHQWGNHKLQWTNGSLTQTTSVSTAVAITDQLFAPHSLNISQPQVLQVVYPVQVSHTLICLLNRTPRTASQQHAARHRPSWSTTLHKLQDTSQVTTSHRSRLR